MSLLGLAAVASAACAAPAFVTGSLVSDPAADSELVGAYVASHINQTFRNASGALLYPYQVPGGPYDQLWDWDSVFVGVASSSSSQGSPSLGGGQYFLGSMANFLGQVNLTTGEVPGCLTPSGASPTLYHAKPIIIQGAFLAARANGGNWSYYKPFKSAMQALLDYWERPPRVDATTGLHTWHDQLETGCDNLVYSQCPSSYSPECWSPSQAYTLASPDLEVLLAREHQAYALFLQAWGNEEQAAGLRQDGTGNDWSFEASRHHAFRSRIQPALDTYLWDSTLGYYTGYNVSTGQRIPARTFQVAWPAWAGMANASQLQASLTSLLAEDLWSPYGVRSTSSSDPRYSNANTIDPYSNWRGPVWANVNAILAYTLSSLPRPWADQGTALAAAVLHTLAQDIRTSGTWHESYDSDTGLGLAAPGFLSWNTLGAGLWGNLQAGVNPFELSLDLP